ncbi:cytochrome P450 [Streptomyces sp. NPDC048638]|uniref:cytochrome P450 n=1 Tax=Streptomyces sp. NPDC048638 TaxID=3365580 RepID=UPI0037246B3C
MPAQLAEPFPWPRYPFDPPDLYTWLRKERPVTRVHLRSGQPVWLVTRYDDVRAILADPRASADLARDGFPQFGFRPAGAHERPFLRMDPPEHTVFRRLLAKSFLAKRMQAMRPRIQQLADDAVDALLASPEPTADLVPALALPVPSTVLSWILGVPAQDRDFFNEETQHLLNRENTDEQGAQERALQAGKSLREYLAGLLAQRESRAEPGDDILGLLVTANRNGSITRQDAVNTAMVLIVAGHDTTANMVAAGTLLLLRHPEQLALLRAEPELLPQAVEEMLRFLTVVHLVVLRVATEDIEIGSVVIPAGEGIVPLNFSANRDDAHYPDADRFDVRRKCRDHVAFGYGVHQCLGQPLARVELEVVFGTLLRRLPTLRLAVPFEDIPFKLFSQINGVSALPVTW